MATVVAIGTLDTKGAEYGLLRERLLEHGVDVILVDAGVLGEPTTTPDIPREELARAAGDEVERLAAAGDRGAAVETSHRGASAIVERLHREGRLDAIVGMGGTGGTALVTHGMQRLPVGVPKLVVSTVASGDTRPYVGAIDITMMYSVVDVAGINQISARIIANAAAAGAGRARARIPRRGRAPGASEAARGRRLDGRAAGRIARGAGHGELRPGRHRAREVPDPHAVRAQPDGDPDANDAGGERRARQEGRPQAQRPAGRDGAG